MLEPDRICSVTELAYNMIQRYGMSDNIGQMAFPKDENALVPDRVYSEVTAQAMDEEAKAIVDQVRTPALC